MGTGVKPRKSSVEKRKILVFGFDRRGYKFAGPKERKHFVLHFEPFNTDHRFDDYDGVILFKGAFEKIGEEEDWSGTHYSVAHDQLALTQRHMELTRLLRRGGFACFLVDTIFVDSTWDSDAVSMDTSSTDLAKVVLNDFFLNRENFSNPEPSPDCIRPEFSAFMEKYGFAYSYYQTYNKNVEAIITPICKSSSRLTGFALGDSIFFVPCHAPKPAHVEDFVTALAEALIECRAKLAFEIPPWLQELKFPIEKQLLEEEKGIQARLAVIRSSLDVYDRYKACLSQDGERLVRSVSTLLTSGFGFQIEHPDEYLEDLSILDSDSKPDVLVEIKGTSRGVKREYINQADSHRERRNLPEDFPTVLIINTHAKESTQLADKDRPIPDEQIKHAVKMRVLVLRTLDLVRLFAQKESGTLDPAALLKTLKTESGWLKASESGFEIVR
jgi:hypothetical protein